MVLILPRSAARKQATAIGLAKEHFAQHLESCKFAYQLSKWDRGYQYDLDVNERSTGNRVNGQPYMPNGREPEFADIAERAPSALAGLVVRTLAQGVVVEGMRTADSVDPMKSWGSWQLNRMDARQGSVINACMAHGQSFGIVLRGKNALTGASVPKWTFRSMRRMSAWYDTDEDEFPRFTIDTEKRYEANKATGGAMHVGWDVRLIDEYAVWYLQVKGTGASPLDDDWTYITHEPHGFPVPPVARCAFEVELEGRATGVIEPILPNLRRIDQDVFDRLIVQRFGAWKVRYIAGMAKPDATNEEQVKIMLRITDLLVSGDPETKFGTLDATSTKDFIDSTDADLRMLSAIAQIPPHHLLGVSSNLQAEALAAASEGMTRRVETFKLNAGEFWETMARLDAYARGDAVETQAYDMQVRWRDMGAKTDGQIADALFKLKDVGIPPEMLWERLPQWTDQDTKRAMALVQGGQFDQILGKLLEVTNPPKEVTGGDKPATGSDK